MVHFGERDACGFQTIADRGGWKSRRIFHAVKSFFLDGGNQTAVGNQGRRGIAVIRVDSKYMHQELFSTGPRVGSHPLPFAGAAHFSRLRKKSRCTATLDCASIVSPTKGARARVPVLLKSGRLGFLRILLETVRIICREPHKIRIANWNLHPRQRRDEQPRHQSLRW